MFYWKRGLSRYWYRYIKSWWQLFVLNKELVPKNLRTGLVHAFNNIFFSFDKFFYHPEYHLRKFCCTCDTHAWWSNYCSYSRYDNQSQNSLNQITLNTIQKIMCQFTSLLTEHFDSSRRLSDNRKSVKPLEQTVQPVLECNLVLISTSKWILLKAVMENRKEEIGTMK